jgi:hypothetical protein
MICELAHLFLILSFNIAMFIAVALAMCSPISRAINTARKSCPKMASNQEMDRATLLAGTMSP